MVIILLQFTLLLLSIVIFFTFALSITILFFPKIIIKVIREKGFFYTFFLVIAIGFTGNAFLGYILDLMRALYWYYHFGITILLIIIVFWKRSYVLNFLLERLNDVFKNVFTRKYWNRNTFSKIMIISPILIILYFNLFLYPILRYSLPLTDPYYTMFIDQYIISNHYLYDPIFPHFYPYGIYYNIFFFSSYCPFNLFWIMKFFGPVVNSLTIIFFGLFISDITKSFLAGIGSILVWLSSYLISTFGVLTVASCFGMYLAIASFSIFFLHLSEPKDKYDDKNSIIFCSGFLLGGGFLYHSIVGGLFPIFGYIFYFLYEIVKKRKIYNTLKFFAALIITALPYIILFRNFTFLFKFLDIINNNGDLTISVPSNFLLSLIFIDFNWDLRLGLNLIDIWGPASIFFLISILSFYLIKDYSKQFIFFFGLTFITTFWIFNPLIINSVPLRDFLDSIYLSARGNYYMVIVISFFTGIAVKSINSVFKKFLKYKRTRNKELRIIIKLIPTFLIITLLINQTHISYSRSLSFKDIPGSHWYNPIDDGYSECLNWLNINAPRSSSVIIPNIDYWKFFDPIRIYRYHQAMAPYINFNENSFLYQYLDLEEANKTLTNLWIKASAGDSITEFSSSKGWFDYFPEYYKLNKKHFVSEWENQSNVVHLEKSGGSGYIFYDSSISSLELKIYFPNSTSGLVYITFVGNDYSNGFRFNIESDEVYLHARYNSSFIFTGISFSTNEWIHIKITSLPLSIFMNSTEIWKNETTCFLINKVLIGLTDYSFYINDLLIPTESLLKLQDEVINDLNNTNFIICFYDLAEFLEYFYKIKSLLDIFISRNKKFSILKVNY